MTAERLMRSIYRKAGFAKETPIRSPSTFECFAVQSDELTSFREIHQFYADLAVRHDLRFDRESIKFQVKYTNQRRSVRNV